MYCQPQQAHVIYMLSRWWKIIWKNKLSFMGGPIQFFSIVNEIYEHHEARSAISLFQMNELFSHHFRGFKIKISDPHNSRNPIRFTALSNAYSNDCQYDTVLCPNKLIYQQQINGLTKHLILKIPLLSRSITIFSNPLSSYLRTTNPFAN